MGRVLKRQLAFAFAVVAAVALCLPVRAVPARPGVTAVRQPDGTLLRVRIIGDEFGHLMIGESGDALVPDADGWLCYAEFTSEGRAVSSGVRCGGQSDGISAYGYGTRGSIPYGQLSVRSAKARRLRSVAGRSLSVDMRPPKAARAIVLLAQFPDKGFKFGPNHFSDMLCKSGYASFGGTGSALDWLNDQYKGATEFVIDIGPVVTVSHSHTWYAQTDANDVDRAAECVYEACRLSDAQVDFSRYDFVYVFYAGGNSADGSDVNAIWPHAWSISEYYRASGKDVPDLNFDGVRVDAYAMSSELCTRRGGEDVSFATIGTFCHEFSHILGQYDLYDTDYESSGGKSDALYATSVMCKGSYNNDGSTPPGYNAVELEIAGLLTPRHASAGTYTLAPISEVRMALKISGEDADEHYLVEARSASGWDKYIGGSGMLVYHVDRRKSADAGYSETYDRNMTPAERWYYNEINCRPDFQCCEFFTPVASGTGGDVGKVFWPYGGRNSFGASTVPPLAFRSGEAPQITLTDIRSAAGAVSFSVLSPLSFTVVDPYQDAVILGWQADLPGMGELSCGLRLYSGVDLLRELRVAPYADGRYACVLEGLSPGSEYSLRLDIDAGGTSYACNTSFATKPYAGKAFIAMGDRRRVPLRVYNAMGAVSVEWTLDGRPVGVEKDGYYTLPSSGVLKAVVEYAGGRRDIIRKTIGGGK